MDEAFVPLHEMVLGMAARGDIRSDALGIHMYIDRFAIEIGHELGLAADTPEVEFGFLLHDVGKLAIPDAILFKPGPLTSEERALMSQHTIVGAEIMRDIEDHTLVLPVDEILG